jgi:electron transfer flavoprotein alpha subunit
MYNEIWVFIETERDEIKKISLEMVSQARELADSVGLSVSAFMVERGPEKLSESPFNYGADRVYLVGGETISPHDTDAHVNLMYNMIKESGPAMLLLGATSLGREMAPRLAARLNAGLISDCVDIKLEKGQLVGRSPVLNGKANTTVVCQAYPFCIATASAGAFDIHELEQNRQGETISLTYLASEKPKVEFLEYVKGDPAKINLKEAEVIIALGRGAEKAENMRFLEELAGLLDASIAGTRVAVDMKWLPLERQIGITGLTVTPRLFISCGISGQYPHTVGMDASDMIIVINKDREAPMFKLATLGVVGSLEEIIPALSRNIKSAKANKEQP